MSNGEIALDFCLHLAPGIRKLAIRWFASQTEIDESVTVFCLGEKGASEFSANQKLWFV
jgi:hypothetical protein